MALNLEQMKADIYNGHLRRQKTAAIQKTVLLNAEEILKSNTSGGELAIKLGLTAGYMTEVNKMLSLYRELKQEGYSIVPDNPNQEGE